MAKMKCALFTSQTKVKKLDGSLAVQRSMTIVMETSMTKCFEAVTVTIDPKDRSVGKIISSTNSVVGEARDGEFCDAVCKILSCGVLQPQDKRLSQSIDEIELLEKCDLLFYAPQYSKFFNRPYGLNDKETKAVNLNRKSLLDFITANFSFDANKLSDFKFSNKTIYRKFAAKLRHWDFDKFWKSPDISPEEKDYATAKLDMDIAMSNADTDLMKNIKRTVFTEYPERDWVFNILFGDPSSGKTTFVETFCALYRIPFVKLTGDPTISMTKLIMTVGPENVASSLTKKDVIAKCKAKGFTDEEIDALKDEINKLVLSSKDVDVQLTEQESLILKCIKHHLPLLVLLDEVNMFTTLLMATLADVITSGYVNVGVHTYKDEGHNIMWFGAYNPNTYKCSPFEGKFRDRALFFRSDMPAIEQFINHKQRKVVASLFDTTSTLDIIKGKVDDLSITYPEYAEKFATEFNLISNIQKASSPSAEAVEFYFDRKVNEILGKKNLTYNAGEYTDYYLNDCQLATQAEVEGAIDRIIRFIDKCNQALEERTKGIDSKNPDHGFFFQITRRSYDFFIDSIFCYSSVEKALNNYIYNLIPNGGTVKYGSSKDPGADIAKEICTTLASDIEELQIYLFSNLSEVDLNRQLMSVLSCDYNEDTWKDCGVGLDEDVSDAVEVEGEQSASSINEYLEELEDIVK